MKTLDINLISFPGLILAWLAAIGTVAVLSAAAGGAVRLACTVRNALRRRSLPSVPAGQCVPDEPEILTAHAWGDSMDGLREDALRRALGLFGPDARLEIDYVEDISTSCLREPQPGRAYRATVIVRCLAAEQVPALDGAA